MKLAAQQSRRGEADTLTPTDGALTCGIPAPRGPGGLLQRSGEFWGETRQLRPPSRGGIGRGGVPQQHPLGVCLGARLQLLEGNSCIDTCADYRL